MRRHEKAPQRAQRTEGLSNGAPLSGLTAHFRPFARTLINCLNTGSQKARKYRGRCSESV